MATPTTTLRTTRSNRWARAIARRPRASATTPATATPAATSPRRRAVPPPRRSRRRPLPGPWPRPRRRRSWPSRPSPRTDPGERSLRAATAANAVATKPRQSGASSFQEIVSPFAGAAIAAIGPRPAQPSAPLRPRLDLRPHPHQVAAEDLADVLVRMPACLQAGDEVGEVGDGAQALGQLAVDAVEIRADADVVDADQLHRVVDLVEHVADRCFHLRMVQRPLRFEGLAVQRGFAGGDALRAAAVEGQGFAEPVAGIGRGLRIDEGGAEGDLHHAAVRRDQLRQLVAEVALEIGDRKSV